MGFLTKYRGLLRTVGGALGGIGAVLVTLPEPHSAAIGAALVKVGSWIGGLGVLRVVAANVVAP